MSTPLPTTASVHQKNRLSSSLLAVLLAACASCAVAPPDNNPHSIAETASRSTMSGVGAASTVRTPVYYQDVFVSFSLEAEAITESSARVLKVYIAPGDALLQDTRWVFEKSVLKDGTELPSEPFTETIRGKPHTSRVTIT